MNALSKKVLRLLSYLRIRIFFIVLVHMTSVAGYAAVPDEFIISYNSMPTSLDPHKARFGPNIAVASHIYDTLFGVVDDSMQPESLILESWSASEDTVWLFKLKKNIHFHDGSLLTSKDVIYSFDRIKNFPESAYVGLVNLWERYEALDDYTIKIVTRKPNANLTRDVGRIFILKHRDTALSTEHFVEDKGYMGTGPYLFDKVTPEGDILLVANKKYHGEPVFLKKVRITRIADSQERVAALKQGKVHLVEAMTVSERALLKETDKVDVIRASTHRILHFALDSSRDQSPFVRGVDGGFLQKNPLKNLKVRRAMSLAINRNALVNTVLQGAGVVAGQYILSGFPGHITGIDPDQWAPDEAHRLLAEAGYPNGFQLSLHGTYNRYIKDKEIIEAVATMWSEVGIKTTPVTLDSKVFSAAAQDAYSATMRGVNTDANLQALLEVLIHTKTPEFGIFNMGGYSNPEIDLLLEQAAKDFNPISRIRSLMEATELSINDYAIIPLLFEKTIWGMYRDTDSEYWPGLSGYTMAFDVHPVRQPVIKH